MCSSGRCSARLKQPGCFGYLSRGCTTGSTAASTGARLNKPVIRLQPRGDRAVTWAEFVEAGLLREYRRTHRVPMAELRTFIDLLREELGVPYPSLIAGHSSARVASSCSRLRMPQASALTTAWSP